MADGPVGSAWVEIRPDLDGFKEELRAGLEADTRDTDQTIHIDADTDDLDQKITTRRQALKAFGDQKFSPKIDADDTELQAKLDENVSKIEALATKVYAIKIKASDEEAHAELDALKAELELLTSDVYEPHVAVGGVDDAAAKIALLTAEVDEFGRKNVTAKVSVDSGGSGRGIDNLRDKIDGGDSGGGGGKFGLVGAVLSLAPAFVTVGAVGGASMLGIAGAATTAGIGLGAFGLAAQDQFKAAGVQAQALLQTWQQTTDEFTAPVIQNALSLIPPILGALTPLVQSVSGALEGLESSAQAALGGSFWQQWFSWVDGQGAVALESFGHLVDGLGTAFAGLVQAAQPAITWVEQGMDQLGAHMTAWGEQSIHSGLAQFIDYAKQNAPLVEKTLENLGHTFSTLAQAIAPLGPVYLNIIDDTLRIVNVIAQLNPTLVELGAGFLTVYKLAQPLGGLSKIWDGIAAFGANIVALPTNLGRVGTALTGIGAAGKEAAVGEEAAGLGLDAMLGPVGLVVAGVTILASVLGRSDQAAKKAGQSFAEDFANNISRAGGTLQAQKQTLQDEVDKLNAIDAAMKPVVHTFTDANGITTTYTQLSKANQEQLDKNRSTIGDLKDKIGSLNEQMQANAASQALQNSAAAQGLTTSQLYSNELKNLTQAESDLQTGIKTATSALQAQEASVLGLNQTQDSWQQAIDNATSSAAKNTGSLDINTKSGLANRTMLDNLSAQTYSQVQAMVAQGASTDDVNAVLTTHQAQLEAVAGKYGITKGAVDAYLDQIKLTPGSVDTTLQTSGYDETLTQLAQVKTAIDQIVNHTATVTITGQIGIPGVNFNPGTGQGLAAGGTISGHPGFKSHTAAVVAEDGSGFDEFVVPTNPVHRGTAVPLAMELNQRLGLMADGGILGSPYSPHGTFVGPTFVGADGAGGAAPWQAAVTAALQTAGSWSLAPILSGANGVIGQWAAKQLAAAQAAAAFSAAGVGSTTATGDAASIIARAQAWLGTPYLWGGGHGAPARPHSIDVDCSGLVDQVFGIQGTTYSQVKMGSPVQSLKDAEPADLLFFSSLAAGEDHHVGIYAGAGRMIDAPFTGTVVRYDGAGSPSQIRRLVSGGAPPVSAGTGKSGDILSGSGASGLARGGVIGAPTKIPMQLLDNGGYLPEGISLAINNTGAPERVPGPGGGGGVNYSPTYNITGMSDPKEIIEQLDRRVQMHLLEFSAALG